MFQSTVLPSFLERGNASTIQNAVTEFSNKAHANKFQMNEAKCKELRISFARTNPQFDPVMINEKPLEIVQHAKLLGLNISSDLKMELSCIRNNQEGCTSLLFLETTQKSCHSN